MSELGEATKTSRGFPLVEFQDADGHDCTIQSSSAVDDSARGMENPGSSFLWLGLDDASPQIMCSKAAENGVTPTGDSGWQPFPIPPEVLLNTRMHLHRDQIPLLIARLREWYATGKFSGQ